MCVHTSDFKFRRQHTAEREARGGGAAAGQVGILELLHYQRSRDRLVVACQNISPD